jgi:hypothetical protein
MTPTLLVDAPPVVDPALVLAEVIVRLRHDGVAVPADRRSLERAHEHLVGLLGALGVTIDPGLPEVDYLMLVCVAARP